MADDRQATHDSAVDHEPQPTLKTQPTQPRGIDPKTGKPYEPIEIPVPTEGDVMGLFEKVAQAPAEPGEDTATA